jgi:hypothetical protein
MNLKNTLRTLMVLIVAGLAAACARTDAPPSQHQPAFPYDQDPATAEAPAEAPAAAPASPPVEPTGRMWLDPLTSCEPLQVSTLHWDDALLSKGAVDIRLGEDVDGPLFGRVGASGEKVTGAWLEPGIVFVARLEDGTELARAVASGPDCEAAQ